MAMETLNPATDELVKSFDVWGESELETALQQVADASPAWRDTSF